MRRPQFETLERRDMKACTAVWQYDANMDGNVTPVDVLVVMDELNARGGSVVHNPFANPGRWMDTNFDGKVSPNDPLIIINWLNIHNSGPQPEPTCDIDVSIVDISSPDTSPMVLPRGTTADVITFSIENNSLRPAAIVSHKVLASGIEDSRIVLRDDSALVATVVMPGETLRVVLQVDVAPERSIDSERVEVREVVVLVNGVEENLVDEYFNSTILFYE